MLDLTLETVEYGSYRHREQFYNIYMVGTGATGSNLLPLLCQLSNNYSQKVQIHIIDGDWFETKNLKNQKCTVMDINRHKAEVLGQRYSKVYPDININYTTDYIYKEEDLELIIQRTQKIQGMDIIIGCVDNNATRKILHNIFLSHYNDCIYIDSGNGTDDLEGQVIAGCKIVTGRNPGKSLVVTPPVASVYPEILEDTSTVKKEVSCGNIVDEKPQNIATNSMAATGIFSILNQIISFDKLNVKEINFNAEYGSMRYKMIPKMSILKLKEMVRKGGGM